MTKRTLLILLSSGLLLSANAWAEQKQLAAPSNQIIFAGQTLTLENHDPANAPCANRTKAS